MRPLQALLKVDSTREIWPKREWLTKILRDAALCCHKSRKRPYLLNTRQVAHNRIPVWDTALGRNDPKTRDTTSNDDVTRKGMRNETQGSRHQPIRGIK